MVCIVLSMLKKKKKTKPSEGGESDFPKCSPELLVTVQTWDLAQSQGARVARSF